MNATIHYYNLQSDKKFCSTALAYTRLCFDTVDTCKNVQLWYFSRVATHKQLGIITYPDAIYTAEYCWRTRAQ